jgi:stage II sporulation protein R
MELVKRFLALMLVALLVTAAAFSLRVSMEQRRLAEKLIRLHVVAASDDAADQARKLRVRDALLPQIAVLTAGCADAEEAEAALRAGLPALERTAAETLGTGEAAAASLTEEAFPRRDYESFSLPAGTYRALRVTLGAGQGHNWWCVAFPALCLPAAEDFQQAAEQAGLSDEEIAMMQDDTAEVQIKFRLLDWLAALFDS